MLTNKNEYDEYKWQIVWVCPECNGDGTEIGLYFDKKEGPQYRIKDCNWCHGESVRFDLVKIHSKT
ncbi:MAG: hypothetical protein QXK76_04275 [Candidatus Woesearchaeota archaeon]